MEDIITNYMRKCCNENGTLYIQPKGMNQYIKTEMATPKVFLQSRDIKILEDPLLKSLEILTSWGIEVIKGNFEPDSDFSTIDAQPNSKQENKNGRGMCEHLYKT